jgi:hypothetical protein
MSDYELARSTAERCIRPPHAMTADGVGWTLWLLALVTKASTTLCTGTRAPPPSE